MKDEIGHKPDVSNVTHSHPSNTKSPSDNDIKVKNSFLKKFQCKDV